MGGWKGLPGGGEEGVAMGGGRGCRRGGEGVPWGGGRGCHGGFKKGVAIEGEVAIQGGEQVAIGGKEGVAIGVVAVGVAIKGGSIRGSVPQSAFR